MRKIIRYAYLLGGFALLVTLCSSCGGEKAQQARFVKKETDSINRELEGINPSIIHYGQITKTIFYLNNAIDPQTRISESYYMVDRLIEDYAYHSTKWYYRQPLWTRAVVLNRALVNWLREMNDKAKESAYAESKYSDYRQEYTKLKAKLREVGVEVELTIADLPEISRTTMEAPTNWIFNGVELPNNIDLEKVVE